MMNATDLDAQVGNPDAAPPPGVQQAPRGFFARNWPRAFLLFSVAVAVLTFVGVIFNFIKIVIRPNATLLNIYCLVFSLLALSAELRQFRWFRKISYHWMKYVYFLTYYKPRGIFYILLGLLLLGDMALLYVAGAVSVAVGFIMLLTSFICSLPIYDDPQERRRELDDARRYYEAKGSRPPTALQRKLGLGDNADTAAAGSGGDQLPANSPVRDMLAQEQYGNSNSIHGGGGQYQPPVLPQREGDFPANHSGSGSMARIGSGVGNVSGSEKDAAAAARRKGAEMFGGPGSESLFGTQAHAFDSAPPGGAAAAGRLGESALRRDFAAAMSADDDSLR